MHGYQITCVLQHPTQMNLKYNSFQQFSPKIFFSNLYTFLAMCSARLCDVTRGHE